MTQLQLKARYLLRRIVQDGPLAWPVRAQIENGPFLSAAQLEALARRRLAATLRRAIALYPFYAGVPKNFSDDEAGAVLKDYFPVIDKQSLLDNPETLYPNRGKRRPWMSVGRTSGTTGTPLEAFRSPVSIFAENAFIRRHWRQAGFLPGDSRITLRGDVVRGLAAETPPFWFFNRAENQLVVSTRHLRDDFLPAIAEKIAAFRPKALQAYPSAAYTLAQYLERSGATIEIPLAFTASEPLYAHQRALIEQRFQTRIFDMYGMAERVAFATSCAAGALHLNTDYSHVEILDENGRDTDGIGSVVGTTFHNHAMPLVRYRLSDQTRWLPGVCACGSPFPTIEPVSGKLEDVLTGGQGQAISASILTFAFKGLHLIKQSQVAQTGPKHWEIRVVPLPGFGEAERSKLIANIHDLVDRDVEVAVTLRDELPRTAAGKFRWVVNEWRKGRGPSGPAADVALS